MTRSAPGALLLLALLAPGCARSGADVSPPVATAPEASAPAAPRLPETRSEILSTYVDASTIGALTAILARAGLSPCAQAFGTGTSAGPPPSSDDRATYVRECEQLPLPVQRCLGLLYASAHTAECKGVLGGLDASARAQVDHLQSLRPTTR